MRNGDPVLNGSRALGGRLTLAVIFSVVLIHPAVFLYNFFSGGSESVVRNNPGIALFSLFWLAVSASLVLSGLYAFLRGLTGADVDNDVALWREQIIVRRGIRFAVFSAFFAYWFLGALVQSGGFALTPEPGGDPRQAPGTLYAILTGLLGLLFLLALFGIIPEPRRGRSSSGGTGATTLADVGGGSDGGGGGGDGGGGGGNGGGA